MKENIERLCSAGRILYAITLNVNIYLGTGVDGVLCTSSTGLLALP